MSKRFSALRNFLNGTPDEDDEQDGAEDQGNEAGDDGEGDDAGEGGEGDEGSAGGDDGAEGDEGEGDAAPAAASADTMAERRRWARVLTSSAAEGRLEQATAMLVEGMSAGSIIRVLGSSPKESNTQLRSVPRHNLSSAPRGEGRDGSRAAESRKKALSGVNSGRKGKDTTSGNRRSGRAPTNQED